MSVTEKLAEIIERAGRPGVLGLPGRRIENATRRELVRYFHNLTHSVTSVQLEELVRLPKADVQHAVTQKLYNPLRLNRSALIKILSRGLMAGVLKGWEHDHRPSKILHTESDSRVRILEADEDDFSFDPLTTDGTLDQLGLTAQKAADFAAEQAAKLVVGIDNTTRERIANAVSIGIEQQLGVPGMARLVRATMEDMTTYRSLMIAATEVNDAFTFAALTKMDATGVEYKRLILSPDACPICQANADAGPIPIGDEFDSGDDGPPFHPLCRCAVTGARAPDEDNNE